jgi:translation initiation factor IF-3
VLPTRRALGIAKDRGLDLVEVSPNSNPPVCRILDYGKYKYEQEKQGKEAKKHKHSELKTIRLRPNIDQHDMATKIRKAAEFLQEGDKVKFEVRFKSREITRPEMGRRLLEKITQALQEHAVTDRPPTMEGRMMSMILGPKKRAGGEKSAGAPETAGRTETLEEKANASVSAQTVTANENSSGGEQNAENQNQQDRSETIQADGDRQTAAQTSGE